MRLSRIRLLSRVNGTGYRGLGGPCSSGAGDDDACETLVQYCAWGVVCHHQLPATGRLPSATSATGTAGVVRRFTGTMLAVRLLASSAAASPSRLPAVARDRQRRLRARRGLPASNAILLCVMWPSTPAGRRLLHSEGARVAFDAFDRLGSRDVPHFVAHSHTPHNCCVRFVAPSPEAHATLTTRRALPLTWAGLPPAGSRQLRLAPSESGGPGLSAEHWGPSFPLPRE